MFRVAVLLPLARGRLGGGRLVVFGSTTTPPIPLHLNPHSSRSADRGREPTSLAYAQSGLAKWGPTLFSPLGQGRRRYPQAREGVTRPDQ